MKTNTRRRRIAFLTPLSILMTLTLPASAAPRGPKAPHAAASSNTPGPENAQIARRVGTWNVVETVWASPGAAPVITHALAERRMIGAFLQEIIRSAPGSAAPDIKRVDYLSFHRLEGRWKYVSMDIRAPVGIMSAASFGHGQTDRIDITFEPFAVPGPQQGGHTTG